MAAAELRRARGSRPAARLPRVLLRSYLVLWAITLGGAAVTALTLRGPVRGVMRLALSASGTPPPSLLHVLTLSAHNLPICAWPLLLGSLRVRPESLGRRVADIVVWASVLANVLPVGAALGGYGGALLPYVPQLPLEWAALAIGGGAWVLERHRGLAGSERLKLLGVLCVALLAAGALETYAVPHR